VNKYITEGYGFTAAGPEDDWIEIDGEKEGICGLMSRVGVEHIAWQLAWAMEDPEGEFGTRYKDKIDQLGGNPPAYRIRITVEAEQLTNEQAAAFWKRRQAK
jgi:hypothetical protein